MSTESIHLKKIASELGLKISQVSNTANLLDEGGSVPFISRYRKEMTGSLDEVQIAEIRNRLEQLRELDKRRQSVIKSIEEQGLMTVELKGQIEKAETLAKLEDIYLPYKPKRKTRASMAKEKGLEPLAKLIYNQKARDLLKEAQNFVDTDKNVNSPDEALQGARDIVAEWISEDMNIRQDLRFLFQRKGTIKSKLIKKNEQGGEKYKDYFDWEEDLSKVPSHRLLAMRRGENEGVLSLDIKPQEEDAIHMIRRRLLQNTNNNSDQLEMAIEDSYKRLLKPSMETEARLESKKRADIEAIKVFAENLKELLLTAPLGQKAVLAIDPGFRTGCKVVVLDRQGKLLHYEAIFPNEPQNRTIESGDTIKNLVEEYDVEAIAIGNGTASRETESFVRKLGLDSSIIIEMVNESGASIYSASEVARNEFPDKDVTVRGAVSIGRRLMDPLAELVKIDAKSIGVGQYQHDVDQHMLKAGLDDVVINCVNSVGVEVNTASAELLTYVSGLGPNLAKAIVDYRNESGPFKDRKALKKVPRLGEKVFQYAAGFLRVKDSLNPLDASAVHPESYRTVERIASDMSVTVKDLIQNSDLLKAVNLHNYVSEDVGLPTLKDILLELEKPGRDPRRKFEVFAFDRNINQPEDLKVGMILPGIVTNVTNFGAFVDIGVHQDGLVHISHLSDGFVDDPKKVVKVNKRVTVTVIDIDLTRKRISLSLKSNPFEKRKMKKNEKSTGREDMISDIEMLKNKFRKG